MPRLAALLLLLLPLISCERARSVFVSDTEPLDTALTMVDTGLYRTDFDNRRGLIIFSANSIRMSVAYDTAMGGIVLAWKGPVDGLRRSMEGIAYYVRDVRKVWSVRRGGDTVAPTVRCLAISADPGVLVVDLALILPSGGSILVREYINHDDHYGDHALETEFHFTGIDSGTAVVLDVDGKPSVGPWPVLWSASVGNLEGEDGARAYVQEFDGVGQLKGTFMGSYDP